MKWSEGLVRWSGLWLREMIRGEKYHKLSSDYKSGEEWNAAE
jgi:hypothetical protein